MEDLQKDVSMVSKLIENQNKLEILYFEQIILL